MNRTKQAHSIKHKRTEFPFSLKDASLDSLKRLDDRVSEEGLDLVEGEELEDLKHSISPEDLHFKSELEYDGYRTIEEADNNALNSLDLERLGDADVEIEIEDRVEDPNLGEESLTDPQENSK